MESTDLIIAHVVPVGSDAERGLDWVIRSAGLSAYHRSKIIAEPRRDVEPSYYQSTRALEAQLSNPEDDLRKSWTGHFQLSLSHGLNEAFGRRWRIGRGRDRTRSFDRDVDLIVTPPDKPAEGVQSVHALIQLNEESGYLMLVGLSNEHPVEYELENAVTHLYLGQKHILYQSVNRFSLGCLQFKLVYENQGKLEHERYSYQRDQYLKKHGLKVPHQRISAIPRRSHSLICGVVIHDTIYRGGFGSVKVAIDAKTGAPRAIKEVTVNISSVARDHRDELAVNITFPNQIGLLQALDHQCEHGESELCGKLPESAYMVFPLAITDFAHQSWSRVSTAVMLLLLRQVLQGLAALHQAGYMHRDVTARNMLIMSLDPPKAVLCDYGKAILAETHIDPGLGPRSTLAPEVSDDASSQYDHKIDIWAFGWACCYLWFPRHPCLRRKAETNFLKDLQPAITSYRLRGALENLFADLVVSMLSWEPANRPSAEDALDHPCMVAAMQVRTQAQPKKPVSVTESFEERPAKFTRIARPERAATQLRPPSLPKSLKKLANSAPNPVCDVPPLVGYDAGPSLQHDQDAPVHDKDMQDSGSQNQTIQDPDLEDSGDTELLSPPDSMKATAGIPDETQPQAYLHKEAR